jgi:uncharacterized protein (DUF1778 family)
MEEGMAMGRPSKAPQDRIAHQLTLGFKPADWAVVNANAAKAETSLTDFIRGSALGQKFTVIQSNNPDAETVDQLRRIGVNLNQIAKAMNAQKPVPQSVVDSACRDVKTVLAQWMFDDPTHQPRPQL